MLTYSHYMVEEVDSKRIQKHVSPYKLAQFYEVKSKVLYNLRFW